MLPHWLPAGYTQLSPRRAEALAEASRRTGGHLAQRQRSPSPPPSSRRVLSARAPSEATNTSSFQRRSRRLLGAYPLKQGVCRHALNPPAEHSAQTQPTPCLANSPQDCMSWMHSGLYLICPPSCMHQAGKTEAEQLAGSHQTHSLSIHTPLTDPPAPPSQRCGCPPGPGRCQKAHLPGRYTPALAQAQALANTAPAK